MKTLKFRTFSSKDRQGFIIFFDGSIRDIIFQDILFQLFEPLFPDILSPQIYYFSSTDQLLSYKEMLSVQDYIYVHFLERVEIYKDRKQLTQKLVLCPFEDLSKGLNFDGVNFYIISQKSYLLYKKDFYREMVKKKIQDINVRKMRKIDKYQQYIKQLSALKDSFSILELKKQLQKTVQDFKQRLQKLQDIQQRMHRARNTIRQIMKSSGIYLKSLEDLY